MIRSIDHIVIAVRDLAEASKNYEKAGFTVTPGGIHTGGKTHNALVVFADGSYFELIALTDSSQSAGHHWFSEIERREGPVAFALRSDDLDEDHGRLSKSKVITDGPRDGGRLRPDGTPIRWRSFAPESTAAPLVPFVIQDVTAHELRVPAGDAGKHQLGVAGIAGVTVAVGDLASAAHVYTALLGPGTSTPGTGIPGVLTTTRFIASQHWIDLAQPADGSTEIGTLQYERGDAVFQIVLAGESPSVVDLPINLTNGARIRIETMR